MKYLGDFPTNATIYIPFSTYDKDDGSSITMTGLAVTDIEIYKNGSVTQRASDAGYTLLDTDGIDFDGITGIHGFSIDTSDNSDAGFFAAGNEYWVVISSVTVDAVTVNFIAATFSIERSGGVLALLKARIPNRVSLADLKAQAENAMTAFEPMKTSVSGRLIDVSANGNAGIDWNNIDAPTTTQNLSGTTTSAVSGAVGSVTGNVGGDVVGSLGAVGTNAINNVSIHSNACAKIADSGIQRGASNWENNSDNRSLGWAISKLVNKIDLNAAGDTLTIRKSNDSTALFTQAVTTSGGAAPVVSLDTAG